MVVYFVLGFFCLVIASLIALASQQPKAFLALMLFYYSVRSSFYFDPVYSGIPNSLNLLGGSINIYVEDIFAVVALISTILFTFKQKTREVTKRFYLAISILLILCFVGIFSWSFFVDFQTSVNFWRNYFIPLSILRYLLATRKSWTFMFASKLIVASTFPLMLLVVIRISNAGVGEVDTRFGQTAEVIRAANYGGALLICTSLFLILTVFKNNGLYLRFVALFQFIAILILQQRTVLFCMIAGLCILLFSKGGVFKFSTKLNSVLLGLISVSSLTFFSLASNAIFNNNSNFFTLKFRIDLWIREISSPRSMNDWLFGSIVGPTPITDPSLFKLTPHNLYLDIVNYFGILGLSILLFTLLSSIIGLRSSNMEIKFYSLFIVIVSIFGFTYTPPLIAFIIWGSLSAIEMKSRIGLPSDAKS